MNKTTKLKMGNNYSETHNISASGPHRLALGHCYF